MTTLTHRAETAHTRCDTLASCQAAIGHLMNPNEDALGATQRDQIATLLNFLSTEQEIALQSLVQTILQEQAA